MDISVRAVLHEKLMKRDRDLFSDIRFGSRKCSSKPRVVHVVLTFNRLLLLMIDKTTVLIASSCCSTHEQRRKGHRVGWNPPTVFNSIRLSMAFWEDTSFIILCYYRYYQIRYSALNYGVVRSLKKKRFRCSLNWESSFFLVAMLSNATISRERVTLITVDSSIS